jgi:imidazolonepropionase-like amidohydrolase
MSPRFPAGFTSVHDVGCYRALADVALRHAINRGDVEGLRMSAVGAYITTPGGGGEVTGFAPDVKASSPPPQYPLPPLSAAAQSATLGENPRRKAP